MSENTSFHDENALLEVKIVVFFSCLLAIN